MSEFKRVDIKTVDMMHPLKREHIGVLLATGDRLANRFGAELQLLNEPVDLSDAVVTGYFIKPDCETVICEGVAEGSTVYVDLPASCYTQSGAFSLAIKVSSTEVTGTVRVIDGVVRLTQTDTLIDPGEVVPSLDELLANIAEMEAVAADAAETVAEVGLLAAKSDKHTSMLKDLMGYFYPVVLSANRYNIADETIGVRMEMTGKTSNNTAYRVSDFIDLSDNDTGYVYAYIADEVSGLTYSGCYSICFYDANKAYLSGERNTGVDLQAVAVPDGAMYARCCVRWNANWQNRPMFVFGSERISWEVYEVASGKIYDQIALKLAPIWEGKNWVSYGDSITAIGNTYSGSWQQYVKDYFRMGDFYGRGIGSQTFSWNARPWFANADGSFHSRDDNASMLDATTYSVPDGCTAHYGYFASWDRITTMIPASIRESVDLITVFGVNDNFQANTMPIQTERSIRAVTSDYPNGVISYPYLNHNMAFLQRVMGGDGTFLKFYTTEELQAAHANDNAYDIAWANDAAYNNFGGDYDITDIDGAVASCIMKLQIWCPNARIVFGTAWSGKGTTTKVDAPNYSAADWKQYLWGEEVKAICGIYSIPVVDLWKESGVSCLNRSRYNSDGLHPYLDEGKRALARAWIGGLSGICPVI